MWHLDRQPATWPWLARSLEPETDPEGVRRWYQELFLTEPLPVDQLTQTENPVPAGRSTTMAIDGSTLVPPHHLKAGVQ